MSDLLWGIDLGGTKIECAVLRCEDVVARHRIPTEASNGYDHILSRIETVVQETSDIVGQKPTRFGIGTPGTLDPQTALMRGANTTALNGRPLLDDLQSRLNLEIRIANDANCFALAEAIMGAGKGHRVVFGVIMGTGVGGGIVVDGKALSGLQGITGEWGHNPLDPQGEPCYCGRAGCVETVLSGPFLERWYSKRTGAQRPLKEIVSAYRSTQDASATALMNHLYESFGRAIASVVNILDPDAIILGGGVGNIDEIYSLGAKAAKSHIFNPNPQINLLPPMLGDSAGVFGAALLFA